MSNPNPPVLDESVAAGANINPVRNRFTDRLTHVLSDLGRNGIFIALLAVVVLFAILTDGILLRPQNISNLVVQNGYILVLAIGMVMVIIAGHIDLSVGSVGCSKIGRRPAPGALHYRPRISCTMPAVATRLIRDSGISDFQARSINWSYRKRGRVHRTHMMNTIMHATFAIITNSFNSPQPQPV